jgi:transglutaminase-like putative cysteine protease
VGLEWNARDLVDCAPVPEWVDHQPYRFPIPETEAACIANGTCRLLFDAQTDLSTNAVAWHYRVAQSVLTREGAERVAHFVVDFDPGYQRLEVHFIRVIRGGECIEHARPEAFQILRRESNLERLVFDGRLTVSLLVPDVRIDDIVEFSLTIYGGVPVLNGKYHSWITFDRVNPFYEVRQRLRRPVARNISFKSFNDPPQPHAGTTDGIEDLRWQLTGQKRRDPEDLTPPWVLLHPSLQLSEFESWNDVAALLSPHYEAKGLPDALAEEVDRIGREHAESSERAAEWLRFVQRELRYFAFSVGEGGLTPRPVETIWSTRFGDCKDASTLYVAGARRLGLDACAALVSTTHGYALRDFLPSAAVFNHCIARLRLDGRSYWLDPTLSIQCGRLEDIYQPHPGWALPLTRETVELEQMGSEEPIQILHWEDEITLGPRRDSPATVDRTIDFTSWYADGMRNRFANEGTGGYVDAMLKEWQSVWPGVAEAAPIEIHDDRLRNTVSLVLKLTIPGGWKTGGANSPLVFAVADMATVHELRPLAEVRRETEIFLGRPRKVTNLMRVHMPRRWPGDGWIHRLEAPGIAYQSRVTFDGRTMNSFRELTVHGWSSPASGAYAYNEVANKLQENLLHVWGSELFGRIRPHISMRGRIILAIRWVAGGAWGAYLLFILLRTFLASLH